VAEHKVRADADAVDFSQVARQFADERLAGFFAEALARNFCDREEICGGTRSGATTALGCRSNVMTSDTASC
jgi:hypothetical protein